MSNRNTDILTGFSNEDTILTNQITQYINNDYAKEYIQERIFIEALITMICASYVIPNIKLPISNSIIVSKLVEIGRADRNQTSKINRLFNNTPCKVCDFCHFDSNSSISIKIIKSVNISILGTQTIRLCPIVLEFILQKT